MTMSQSFYAVLFPLAVIILSIALALPGHGAH